MKIIIHSAFDKDIGLAFSRTEINSNLCRKEGIKRISQFVFLITFEKFIFGTNYGKFYLFDLFS